MEENINKPQMSIEEELTNLKYYCQQLIDQNKQLRHEMARMSSVIGKLPWLFKTLKYSEFFEPDFVKSCSDEITEILRSEEESTNEEN